VSKEVDAHALAQEGVKSFDYMFLYI